MDTGKTYHDSYGQECSIWQMVRREPDWAANRVQEGEKAIDLVKELEERNKVLSDVIIDYSNGLICEKCGGMLFSDKMKEKAAELMKLMTDKRPIK